MFGPWPPGPPWDLVLVCVDKAAVLLLTTLEQIVWQTHSLFLQGLSMNLTYLFHELTFIVVCAKWCNCSLGAQSILVTIHFPESRKICQESASHCTLFKRSEEHSFFFCTMHGIVMSVVMALVYPVFEFLWCLYSNSFSYLIHKGLHWQG